jgi:hypothetical protein
MQRSQVAEPVPTDLRHGMNADVLGVTLVRVRPHRRLDDRQLVLQVVVDGEPLVLDELGLLRAPQEFAELRAS